MTTRELRKLLASFPPDAEVVLAHPEIGAAHVSVKRVTSEQMSPSIVPGYYTRVSAVAPGQVPVVVLAPRKPRAPG